MPSVVKVTVLTIVCAMFAVGCRAQARVEAAPTRSNIASGSAKTLPEQFAAALSEVKSKSRIPVLLPSELPQSISKAKHAVVEKASDNEYAIALYYTLGTGDAGFAGFFDAEGDPNYNPQELGDKVQLSHRLLGYFRPVSCGGSCAPANLSWKYGRVLYQIQLRFPSTLRDGDQQKSIVAAANSAILAGPR